MNVLRSSEMEAWCQLSTGTVVSFDNWRVLHGRSSFTGDRRMVGCYINWDDYQSQLKTVCDKSALKEFL